MVRNFCLGVFLCVACASTSYGLGFLNYRNDVGASNLLLLNSFLAHYNNTDFSAYGAAEIYLNDDSVYEYILKPNRCEDQPKEDLCSYLILGEKNSALILLGHIKARTLLVGETSSYGVKDILAFRDQLNDYNFDIYIWSPSEKTYIMRGAQLGDSKE